MARNQSTAHATGARALGGGRRRGAWLRPLLALLVLLLLVGLVIALVSGDDDSGDKSAGGGQTSASAGSLTASGRALLPAANGGLKQQIGQDASGKDLVVQSVVANEGFWVGTSQADRVYIEYGSAAGKTEAGFHPDRAGQRVNLDGPVRPAPADPAQTLKLDQADAARVKQQGAYINANNVQPAG